MFKRKNHLRRLQQKKLKQLSKKLLPGAPKKTRAHQLTQKKKKLRPRK